MCRDIVKTFFTVYLATLSRKFDWASSEVQNGDKVVSRYEMVDFTSSDCHKDMQSGIVYGYYDTHIITLFTYRV